MMNERQLLDGWCCWRLVRIALAAIVLLSAVRLLPPPPGSPTATAPFILDRPRRCRARQTSDFATPFA